MAGLLTNTYSVTKKGQVTIPLSLRKKLNLKEGDKVVFEEGENEIKVKRSSDLQLASVFGSVKPLKRKLSFKKMREIALEDKFNVLR
ncbi:MAG: hypothetical protein UT00_C0022G0006 [Parcubacteria group bacterium GW2011_GWA1_38_7]|nr:MAG: hypothetical protein UT00_C0022G0006 [Parcubacteria group bacterium GW2011_GWA1_38_7]